MSTHSLRASGALQAAPWISPHWACPDGRSRPPAALQAQVASGPPLHHTYTGTVWVSSTELLNPKSNVTSWVSSTELLR